MGWYDLTSRQPQIRNRPHKIIATFAMSVGFDTYFDVQH